MTCNFACLTVIVVGFCYLTETPLSAVQLIWINLVMDIFGAIALSSVRPDKEDSKQPIVADKVLHTYNYRAIYGNSIWMILMMMIAIFGREAMWGIEKYPLTTQTECTVDIAEGEDCVASNNKKTHLTLIFNTFMFFQIWNLLNAKQVNKKKLNPFSNLLLSNWIVVAVALALAAFQYVVCFLWIGVAFEIAPVEETIQFSSSVALAATVLASAALLKYVPEKYAAKIPVLNEEEALGSSSKLMQAYETQANAKAFTKKEKKGEVFAVGDGTEDFDDQL